MNKTKEQIELMVENAVRTAREEHRIHIGIDHLEHIALELLSELTDKYLRSVFGTFTLSDTLLLISHVEEQKVKQSRKIRDKDKLPKGKAKTVKTEAH